MTEADQTPTETATPSPDNSGSDPLLNQEEIDTLMGYNQEGSDADQRAGFEALVNRGLVSYERLPMLEVVFDRLVRLMTTSLRNFTSDNVEVSIEKITSLRFDDYIESIPLPAILTVFKAIEWDNHGLIVVDSTLIYSIVDVLLGGRRGANQTTIEGRPYTTIERRLVERMVHIVLNDLSAAFDPLSSVTFRYDRLETNPRFATITRPSNAAILTRLKIHMDDRGGCVDLIIPYATLEPIREVLLQMFIGEKLGRDSIWENHLVNELWQTNVNIQAILDEQSIPLEEALNWEVGSYLPLSTSKDAEIELRCDTFPLFTGFIGKRDRHLAVRIEKRSFKLPENNHT